MLERERERGRARERMSVRGRESERGRVRVRSPRGERASRDRASGRSACDSMARLRPGAHSRHGVHHDPPVGSVPSGSNKFRTSDATPQQPSATSLGLAGTPSPYEAVAESSLPTPCDKRVKTRRKVTWADQLQIPDPQGKGLAPRGPLGAPARPSISWVRGSDTLGGSAILSGLRAGFTSGS